jgi:hypothetical protein
VTRTALASGAALFGPIDVDLARKLIFVAGSPRGLIAFEDNTP